MSVAHASSESRSVKAKRSVGQPRRFAYALKTSGLDSTGSQDLAGAGASAMARETNEARVRARAVSASSG